MGLTKDLLAADAPAYGTWIMVGHPAVAELLSREGFTWIAVDLEHTTIDLPTFEHIARAMSHSGCDLFARLPSCDPVIAKQVLDAGADGYIVPFVNTRAQAELAVAMGKYPPDGIRGAGFGRASDYGRSFRPYFDRHNATVFVAVMLEHIDAVANADAILSVPGVDAAFVGPYDLSCSMGLPGELDHPDVQAALETILAACARHGVAPGLHVVAPDPVAVQAAVARGFRFVACGIDTQFLMDGARRVLGRTNGL